MSQIEEGDKIASAFCALFLWPIRPIGLSDWYCDGRVDITRPRSPHNSYREVDGSRILLEKDVATMVPLLLGVQKLRFVEYLCRRSGEGLPQYGVLIFARGLSSLEV